MEKVRRTKAAQKAATREKLLQTAFHLFAEKTIDAVNLTEVAEAAGVSFMTSYRHFDKKPDLVLAVNDWSWNKYRAENMKKPEKTFDSGAARYEYFLDCFLDLYRDNRDILRFNQYFNAFVKREGIPKESMAKFNELIADLQERFKGTYAQGMEDGTLRSDVSEKEMFSATLHLMLAAVTRYAVGLVYESGVNPEQELLLLKKLLMQEYTVDTAGV